MMHLTNFVVNANAVPVLAIFEKKVRLEVPLFQRSYVWNREHQWGPLWDDFARKFTEHLEGRPDAPVHFLGAMVLDQKATPTTHVERRQIIDGQQRLTTLQLFLAAFRDFCKEHGCEDLAQECQTFTLNTGMMANHAYATMKNPTLVYILRRLNQTYLTNKHEDLVINNPLSVEHLLPQDWTDQWPLPDDTKGLNNKELPITPADDARLAPTRARNAALQTMGNLTILTTPLNSSVSNGPWKNKRPAILGSSLLPINQALHQYEMWDEEQIKARGRDLLNRARERWPKPTAARQTA